MNFNPEFYNVLFVLFNFLIVLLTSFLDFHSRVCDFFKGDYPLSSVCLADNMDSLEDDDADLDDVTLDSESELSSDGIDSTSSADRSRYSSLTASFLRSWSCNPSLAVFIIFIISVVSNQ